MEPIVEIATGKLRGRSHENVDVFRGIPYAEPPRGPLRFRPPKACQAWVGLRDALHGGPWAPQRPVDVPLLRFDPTFEQDESCLTLTVWAPHGTPAARPVVVFIHGGGFVRHSGASALTDGTALARAADVLVVAINYRLGLLGFMSHADLCDDTSGWCGNWGLLDQIAALEWVQENIAAFGGDPSNVTLMGESAGGISISALLAMPRARGLFHKAIVQSGPPLALEASTAERTAEEVADQLGVTDVASLRSFPVEALLDAQDRLLAQNAPTRLPLGPVVDGTVLLRDPVAAALDDDAPHIPLLIGTNADEVRLFFAHDPQALIGLEGRDLAALLERSFRLNAVEHPPTAVIDTYRTQRAARGESLDPGALWSAIETDRMFVAPSRQLAQARTGRGHVTYTYRFTWTSPAHGGALGACHALELPFAFGTFARPEIRPFSGDSHAARRVSENMQAAWAAFVHQGTPAIDGAEPWPEHAGGQMQIADECQPSEDGAFTELKLWCAAT